MKNIQILKDREDKAATVREWHQSTKWAALGVLCEDLSVRLTQVDVNAKKLEAFKHEQENEV